MLSLLWRSGWTRPNSMVRPVLNTARGMATKATSPKITMAMITEMLASCGVETSGGTKAELQTRLTDHLFLAQSKAFSKRLEHPVLSVDIGLKNMAYCLVGHSPTTPGAFTVLDWDKVDIAAPESYSPSAYTRAIEAFVNRLPRAEAKVCLVERQRFISGGLERIPLPVLKGTVIEALLHALIPSRSLPTVLPVLPRRVAIHFGLDPEKGSTIKGAKRTAQKKRAAIDLATILVALDGPVECPPKFRRRFMDEKKKDDLSDSLLQAIAWLEWQRWAREEAKGLPHTPLLTSILGIKPLPEADLAVEELPEEILEDIAPPKRKRRTKKVIEAEKAEEAAKIKELEETEKAKAADSV